MDTIHLISHTHWDREWYLTYQQLRLKLVHLVDQLLDILENDPDFKYYLLDGQAIILEDYLQLRPEREPDLVRFIQNGRLLIGPWYVSPDEYLVAPESHIRNLLEGDKLCRKYGGKMLVGYLPDTFGHIGQMPQILQGFGINSACLWRGLDNQPCEFNWQASDGSQVLVSYLKDSYSNAARLTTSNPEKFIQEVDELGASLSPHSATGQILLMHGTDHMEPSADVTRAIVAYQNESPEIKLIHSSLPQYFGVIFSRLANSGAQLPVITGELRSSRHTALLQNVLSTRIWLKQRNHNCENELLKWVEPICAWINLLNTSNPIVTVNNPLQKEILTNQNSIIRYAWKLLMQCHPHDSICGTSIDQVANEIRIRFDQVDQINHELVNQGLQKISEHINTRIPRASHARINQQNMLSTIVVFNPNDTPQTGLVNLNLKHDNPATTFEIIDNHGKTVPFDQIGLGARELISMTLDKKTLKQALGMIHEGVVAGMVIRDFVLEQQENQVTINATLSDHGVVDVQNWRQGIFQLEQKIADPKINEYYVHAYSDPEINLSMPVMDVPGHGYRCYWIRSAAEKGPNASKQIKLSPAIKILLPLFRFLTRIPITGWVTGRKFLSANSLNNIENEFFKVEAHSVVNSLSITDKRTGQLYADLNQFVDGADCGDLYNYCPPECDQILTARITKVEQEIRNTYQKLIINYELKIPARLANDRKSRSRERFNHKIKSIITIVPGVPRIDVHTELENRARDHRLRLNFPAPFLSAYSHQDGHFEIVKRQIGIPDYDDSWEEPPRPEVPQRQFTSIADDHRSLTIANRGLPEVEVFKNQTGNSEIAITLLRCINWLSRDDLKTRKGHAGPMGVATPDAQMIGSFDFDYSIILADNCWQKQIHHAYAFNAPLKSITTSIHSGKLPSEYSFIDNKNEDFVITAIKQSEDDSGLIVRGFNILSSPIDVSVKSWTPFKHAYLISLDEKIIESLPISPIGTIQLHVGGNKIVSILFMD